MADKRYSLSISNFSHHMQPRNNIEFEADVLADVHDWATQKLIAKESFSVLLVSLHPSGKKLTRYQSTSVGESLNHCRAELSGNLGDASAYALVYPLEVQVGNSPKQALVFQTEQRGSGAHELFEQRYDLKKKWFSESCEFIPCEDIRAVENGAPWLDDV